MWWCLHLGGEPSCCPFQRGRSSLRPNRAGAARFFNYTSVRDDVHPPSNNRPSLSNRSLTNSIAISDPSTLYVKRNPPPTPIKPRQTPPTMRGSHQVSLPLKPLQQMLLSHNCIATRNAVSGLKSSYHLFLRNQPKAPEKLKRRQIPRSMRREWDAPEA